MDRVVEEEDRVGPGVDFEEMDGQEVTEGEVTLTITNDAFQQPFSSFFVMTHNDNADPLYIRGKKASEALARLAEDGNPNQLMETYADQPGVGSVSIHSTDIPLFGRYRTKIRVQVTKEYPRVTIASMAMNTNDCFVAINGAVLTDGQVLDLPGLDAGSEINNELCDSIPGPACGGPPNVQSGGGEGFVHVHRGFFGVGDLSEAGYAWRNPMMRVGVSIGGASAIMAKQAEQLEDRDLILTRFPATIFQDLCHDSQ